MQKKKAQTPGATGFSGPDVSKCEGVTSAEPTEHGQALIITLCFIVLATVLAVAFLTNVTTAGVGENAVASENRASQLAATAVQLVEGTIGFATESGTFPTVAWASQPGMIRTYGSGTPGGTVTASYSPLAYYKLYSSNNMVVTNQGDMNPNDIFTADVPTNWDADPAVFTDLNAPLTIASSGGNSARVFPIADPRAADSDIAVEGFSYNAKGASGTIDGVVNSGTSTGVSTSDTTDLLPMPVRWMYVLQDGSLVVPDSTSSTGNSAVWATATSGTNVPTATNPIVGRIAFWTDDECNKVNVNTASEGTYWDTPIAESGGTNTAFTYPQTLPMGDNTLAAIQPVQHEYQRYPGHPATTCLSAVFGTLLNSSAYGSLGSNRAQMVKTITDMIPRISDYGNVNGYSAPAASANTTLGGSTPVTSGTEVITDQDRLYASLDEFQFSPPQSPYATSGVVTRSTQNWDNNTSAATQAGNYVDTCRFFLTAHSKGSELNMFGLPRVSIWPLWDSAHANYRSTFDNEILQCSTINASGSNNDPHPMCIFRYDPTSPINDYTYTQSNITRNPQIFQYLQALTNMKIPGYGGESFLQKYVKQNNGVIDRDQILAEIFDYIRCTNLADNSPGATPYTAGTTGAGAGVNQSGVGQVVPIQINSTRGFGRIATIGELTLALVKVDDRANTALTETGTNFATTITVTGAPTVTTVNPKTQTLLEWALVPSITSSMAGYVAMANNIRIHFNSINLTIGGTAVTNPTVTDIYTSGLMANTRDSVMGGNIGPLGMVAATGIAANSAYPTGLVVVNGTDGYPNGSGTYPPPITVKGSCQLTLYAPAGSGPVTANQLQVFNFQFPTAGITVPLPSLAVYSGTGITWAGTFRAPASAYSVTSHTTNANFAYPTSTYKNATRVNSNGDNYFIGIANGSKNVPGDGTDVLRSLTPIGPITSSGGNILGDTRLLTTVGTVPTSTFELTLTGSGLTPGAQDFWATSMRCGTGYGGNFGSGQPAGAPQHIGWGTLMSGTNTRAWQYPPAVPPQTSGSIPGTGPYPGTGDWDNGEGAMEDGPWVNKPDEGMTQGGTTLPYIGSYTASASSGAPLTTNFSPNRQISSPVMFGSLSVGSDAPWRTLLFRPATLPGFDGGYTHPGNASPNTVPPDHLLLDLFWMPVVEPYGISEPFATSGKINLNTQIAPFTYITRQTGLHALLKPVMITALNPNLPTSGSQPVFALQAHGPLSANSGSTYNGSAYTRIPIDLNATVGQLSGNDTSNAFPEFARSSHTSAYPNFFVSATQICDLPLIPVNPANGASGYYYNGTTSNGSNPPGSAPLSQFWPQNQMTGDNSLERPYSMIYPRATTKSNIFTVHVIAQSLKQTPIDRNQGTWTENVDQVTGEFHGAFTIEKYYDPDTTDLSEVVAGHVTPWPANNDGSIPINNTTVAIRGAKWRLLGVKRFGQ